MVDLGSCIVHRRVQEVALVVFRDTVLGDVVTVVLDHTTALLVHVHTVLVVDAVLAELRADNGEKPEKAYHLPKLNSY